MTRWTSAYAASGEPLDGGASMAPSAYEGGPITYFVDRASSIAPGAGSAFLVGSFQTCTVFLPGGGTECSPTRGWIERYVASAVPQWRKPAGGTWVVADNTGAYVVGGSEARMQKFDATGTLVWDRTFLPSGGDGTFWDAAAFPGGGAVAVGRSEAGPLLQRVDAGGTARWASTVVPALGASTILQRVAVDAAGNVYAAGTRVGATPGVDDIVMARFDADGGLAWMRTRPGVAPGRGTATHDMVTALAVDAGGNAIVAGTASTAVDYVAWTAKIDPAGRILWSDEFTTRDDARTEARALGLDALGHAYVGGTGVGASGIEGFVRKLGPGGAVVWTLRWAGILKDVIVGGGGELLVLASASNAATLMRLDPGAAEGAAPPTLLLTLPPGPLVAGMPVTLTATLRGATTLAPTGVATFRVDGVDACTAVVLQPATATTSKAQCVLPQGLPVGTVRIEVAYGGDANNATAVASANVSVVAVGVAVAEVPMLGPGALGALVVLLVLVGMRAARRPD